MLVCALIGKMKIKSISRQILHLKGHITTATRIALPTHLEITSQKQFTSTKLLKSAMHSSTPHFNWIENKFMSSSISQKPIWKYLVWSISAKNNSSELSQDTMSICRQCNYHKLQQTTKADFVQHLPSNCTNSSIFLEDIQPQPQFMAANWIECRRQITGEISSLNY